MVLVAFLRHLIWYVWTWPNKWTFSCKRISSPMVSTNTRTTKTPSPSVLRSNLKGARFPSSFWSFWDIYVRLMHIGIIQANVLENPISLNDHPLGVIHFDVGSSLDLVVDNAGLVLYESSVEHTRQIKALSKVFDFGRWALPIQTCNNLSYFWKIVTKSWN